jgi:hypothetical protein
MSCKFRSVAGRWRAPAFGEVMAQLGWTAVRVRGVTRGGYLEQVRGYARDTGIALSLRVATAHPSRRQTLRDASWAFQIGVEHLGGAIP